MAPSITYPQPRRDETVSDDYHGTKVSDPYRWLEDPDSEETKNFVVEQNKISSPFINSCDERETIKKELTELWNYEKYGCPHKEGNKYFFSKNTGLQNQSVIFMQDSLEAEPKVLLDPNSLSEDGTVSLRAASWSHDGSILAYGLSQSGSDWVTIKFKNVETGQDFEEVLEKVKFSGITWTHDNLGVFYGCYPEHSAENVSGTDTASHENQKLYYHRVGTPQSEDVLCVEFLDQPKWMIGCTVSDCGRYLFVTPSQDCKYNLLYFCDLEEQAKNGIKEKFSLTEIVTKFEADYDYVTNQGSKVVFHTNKGAEKYRLVLIDLTNPSESAWTDLVGESEDVLEWATGVAGDKLVTCYMHHVKNTMQLRDLNTGNVLHQFELDIGSVTGFSGDIRHKEMFYKFSSQITPGTIYHVDLSGQGAPNVKVMIQTKVHGFDSSQYKVEQVFYPSKDGTKIPMFITMRKDFVPDSTTPCLLYGYGGFSISLTPYFSTVHTFFVQHFGIMAIANMRGGGEYGESWQNGGRKENLQNCLTDFQYAAEWLVSNKYTNKDKLTIYGGSHGGMLVGACANQRPDLYGAAVSAVGVMDMLRFHKFTVGYAWVSNYGCSDVAEEFPNLLSISPLHNIKEDSDGPQYPAILLLTADHDDRVVPSHSLKYIATLQQTCGSSSKQTNPLMIRVDCKSGHGAGKPTSKSIEEYTDIFCFLVRTLGLQYQK